MGYPSNHLELVSAYFVPTRSGTAFLSKQSRQGIKIRILTNSFIANDVAIVHAFYSKYRQALLESGVKLYELKSIIPRKKPTWYEKLTGRVIPAKGKSNSSLHAKFFDIEEKCLSVHSTLIHVLRILILKLDWLLNLKNFNKILLMILTNFYH
jgi:putative cardiolipin synthase